jgi:RNA ligase
MLQISHIDPFKAVVLQKEEIRMADIGQDCVSFCYMISGADTFDTPESRECRGIVFNKAGHVVGRPLHKFFNVNERAETQMGVLDWSKVVRVMDKRDGSMIHSVITPAGIMLKSKKTFSSDVAQASQKWMDARPLVASMVSNLAAQNLTAIFEWTAPDARIVLFYPDAELQLLHIRDNLTGQYVRSKDLREFAAMYGVKCVDEVDEFFWTMGGEGLPVTREFDIKKMLEAAETREGVEGWVIQFEDGNMVKLKTKWYMERHRIMTFLRERDIAEAVVNETLDDTKAALVGEGVNIDRILEIEAEVVRQINHVRSWVEDVIATDGHLPRKDFALHYMKTHQEFGWFGLLMARFSGKEPNYNEWYLKHVLKDKWSLQQLVLMPSIAEGD